MVTYVTSREKTINQGTAQELEYFRSYAQMESVGRRTWAEVLTEEERVILGGDFSAAFREGGTLGMYHVLYPGLSFERAMLELLLELGAMQFGVYRKLLRHIGENDYLPVSRGARPHWDGQHLSFNGEVIRKIARPATAKRLTAILGAFERHGWPQHLPRHQFGQMSARTLSDALEELRKGLSRITFEMDGSGTGITWRPI